MRSSKKMSSVLCNTGVSGVWCKEQNHEVCLRSSKHVDRKLLIGTLIEKKTACNYGEIWVWTSRWVDISCIFLNFGKIVISMNGIKPTNFPSNISTSLEIDWGKLWWRRTCCIYRQTWVFFQIRHFWKTFLSSSSYQHSNERNVFFDILVA